MEIISKLLQNYKGPGSAQAHIPALRQLSGLGFNSVAFSATDLFSMSLINWLIG